MPNKKNVRNPKTEYLLTEFKDIVKEKMILPDGKIYGLKASDGIVISSNSPIKIFLRKAVRVSPVHPDDQSATIPKNVLCFFFKMKNSAPRL